MSSAQCELAVGPLPVCLCWAAQERFWLWAALRETPSPEEDVKHVKSYWLGSWEMNQKVEGDVWMKQEYGRARWGEHKGAKANRIQTGIMDRWREPCSGARQTYGDALRNWELISDWQYSCLHLAEVKGEGIYAFVLN